MSNTRTQSKASRNALYALSSIISASRGAYDAANELTCAWAGNGRGHQLDDTEEADLKATARKLAKEARDLASKAEALARRHRVYEGTDWEDAIVEAGSSAEMLLDALR